MKAEVTEGLGGKRPEVFLKKKEKKEKEKRKKEKERGVPCVSLSPHTPTHPHSVGSGGWGVLCVFFWGVGMGKGGE